MIGIVLRDGHDAGRRAGWGTIRLQHDVIAQWGDGWSGSLPRFEVGYRTPHWIEREAVLAELVAIDFRSTREVDVVRSLINSRCDATSYHLRQRDLGNHLEGFTVDSHHHRRRNIRRIRAFEEC